MRFLTLGLLFALGALALLASTSDAQVGKKSIKPTKSWSGKKDDENLKIKAPATGFVTDAKTFDEMWKAWRPTEKTPDVDFKTSIVVVSLSSGPNIVRASFFVNDQGNVTTHAISTLIGGPGFGYALDVLPRDGIKSIEGKAIEVK